MLFDLGQVEVPVLVTKSYMLCDADRIDCRRMYSPSCHCHDPSAVGAASRDDRACMGANDPYIAIKLS